MSSFRYQEPLKSFKQETDKMRFAFEIAYSSGSEGLRSEVNTGGGLL